MQNIVCDLFVEDGSELAGCAIWVIVDHSIIIAWSQRHLAPCCVEPRTDRLFRFRPAAAETAFQRIQPRRSKEHGNSFGQLLLHLRRSLDLNVQNHGHAAFQPRTDLRLRRTVAIADKLGML